MTDREPNPLPYVRDHLNEQQSPPVYWIAGQPGRGKVDMALELAERHERGDTES